MALRKGKRPWEFCFNINCEANKALREEWERKKAAREAKEAENKEIPQASVEQVKTEIKQNLPTPAIVDNKEKPKKEKKAKAPKTPKVLAKTLPEASVKEKE